MQNNRTKEHTKDTNREENRHSTESVVGNLKIILSIQKKTTKDTSRATDNIGNDIVDWCPLCKPREDEEIKGSCTTANNTIKNQISEFAIQGFNKFCYGHITSI